MPDNRLSVNVMRLLDSCIGSVSELETLLFLYKHKRPWTARQVANELYTNDLAMHGMLSRLAANGLIGRITIDGSEHFYYESNGSLDADISDLAVAYKDLKMRVIDRIYARPGSSGSLQSLADSFIIKDDDK